MPRAELFYRCRAPFGNADGTKFIKIYLLACTRSRHVSDTPHRRQKWAVAVPVVAVGSTTDIDVGAADGLLPDVADFDPALAVSGGDEVTAAAPDGSDFDPASLDSVWAHGGDAPRRRCLPTLAEWLAAYPTGN